MTGDAYVEEKMAESDSCDLFHSENNIFITSTKTINGTDLKKFFMKKLSEKNVIFPKGTTFYIIAGIIHPSKDGTLGRSDLNLSQDFYYDMIPDLKKFCGNLGCDYCNCNANKFCKCDNQTIWEKMEYKYQHVQLSTNKRNINGKNIFELNPVAMEELTELSDALKRKDGLSTFVFASCFSKNSVANQVLRSKGIISIAQLVKDMNDVTDGKMCQLDNQQLKVITDINQVKSMFNFNH